MIGPKKRTFAKWSKSPTMPRAYRKRRRREGEREAS